MAPAMLAAPSLAVALALQGAASDLYDPDPTHPWNRAHAAICAREGPGGVTLGLDTPFPLLWWASDHLLEDERYAELLVALDALAAPSPRGVRAALLMQSDLWALCDWASTPSAALLDERDRERRAAIASAAARAMRVLAPTAEELATLADPLAEACAATDMPARAPEGEVRTAFLPRDLAGPAWALLGDADGAADVPLAAAHAEAFGGRASFAAYLRLPEDAGGAGATAAYLASLRAHRGLACDEACAPGPPAAHLHLDPSTPPPPAGTQVALVQRLLAVDADGALHATPVPLVVQLREYLPTPADAPALADLSMYAAPEPYQAFAELHLERRRFLAGAPALVALRPDEPAFDIFGGHGDEVELARRFPQGARLASCVACHGVPGALALNVYTAASSGPGSHLNLALRRPTRVLVPQTPAELADRAKRFLERRETWEALRVAWTAGG
jgi:hypothetical protein